MGFTEVTFLFVFMPISIILYLLVERLFHNDKANNSILVALSLLFYYWASKESLVVFLAIVVFTYMAGLSVVPNANSEKQKMRLALPIAFLVGLLAFYKYISLIVAWIKDLSKLELIKIQELVVPIGLSFVIFESISYVVDIYRGDVEAGSLLDCFTFLSLFPKLVSGPIILWKDFKGQLQDRRISIEKVSGGIDRIIIGYAKKAIIADTFGAQIILINNGIAAGGVDIPTMWLKALLYFFQIYLDFSGYSDIAIGLCKIFGFDIRENFDFPYLSKSISEFWRRWHISLGRWFREYVYIPLGGNKRGNVYIHLMIVFLITGVWHGSNWQFLVWGGVHGICVVIERVLHNRDWYERIPSIIKWFISMIIIYFAWILFSSVSIEAASQTYINMFVPMTNNPVNFSWRYYLSNRIKLFLVIVIMIQVLGMGRNQLSVRSLLNGRIGRILQRGFFLMVFVADIMYVVSQNYSPFIYFQF